MLDSAGKRVAEQGQLQFLAERRERLDIPDGCRQRIPRVRRSHRKRAVTEGGLLHLSIPFGVLHRWTLCSNENKNGC